jgi:hypothetical protein
MNLNAQSIPDAWRRAFGEVPAWGPYLRELNSRWFRIHSLPQSKRYPENEFEYQEMLRRHNAVALAVLGDEARCLLLVGFWPPSDLASELNVLPDIDSAFQDVAGLPEWDDPPYPDYGAVTYKAAPVRWLAGRFDVVIRAVADEAAPIIIFTNLEARTAYVPYDGGADLICESEHHADELREKFSSWLPSNPMGL